MTWEIFDRHRRHPRHKPELGFVSLSGFHHHHKHRHRHWRQIMASVQNAQPGQSGLATASEFTAAGEQFTITDPNALVWTTSDPANVTAVAVGDGTPTAKVSIGLNTPTEAVTISASDPAFPSIVWTPGTVDVTATPPPPTTGEVDLGAFS
jgi:hypothetical protein